MLGPRKEGTPATPPRRDGGGGRLHPPPLSLGGCAGTSLLLSEQRRSLSHNSRCAPCHRAQGWACKLRRLLGEWPLGTGEGAGAASPDWLTAASSPLLLDSLKVGPQHQPAKVPSLAAVPACSTAPAVAAEKGRTPPLSEHKSQPERTRKASLPGGLSSGLGSWPGPAPFLAPGPLPFGLRVNSSPAGGRGFLCPLRLGSQMHLEGKADRQPAAFPSASAAKREEAVPAALLPTRLDRFTGSELVAGQCVCSSPATLLWSLAGSSFSLPAGQAARLPPACGSWCREGVYPPLQHQHHPCSLGQRAAAHLPAPFVGLAKAGVCTRVQRVLAVQGTKTLYWSRGIGVPLACAGRIFALVGPSAGEYGGVALVPGVIRLLLWLRLVDWDLQRAPPHLLSCSV